MGSTDRSVSLEEGGLRDAIGEMVTDSSRIEPVADVTDSSGTRQDALVPLDGSEHRCESGEAASKARKLGIAKDVVSIGDKGVSVGFGIAKLATRFGFNVASKCIQTSASAIENMSGPNFVSSGLAKVDSVVTLAGKATSGCQHIAETITHASLSAAKTGLKAAGAEERSLLRLAYGEEAADSVAIVELMVRRYSDGLTDVPLKDLLAAAVAWGALQQATVSVHGRSGEAASLPEHSERWLRFAAATMGVVWFAGMLEGLSVSAVARARAAAEQGGGRGDAALACAGVEGRVEVLRFEENTSVPFAPGYIVAVDHEVGCVVVALRGTSSLMDALTDAVCEVAPLELGGEAGVAHGGMLRSAQRYDHVLGELVETGLSRLDALGPRRIVICGHSLGAGVAALLTALWCDRGYLAGADMQCFAFACPQVLDPFLAAAQSKHTVSFVVGDDLVPRFSLATAQDLRAAMLYLNNPETYGLSPSMQTQEILAAQTRGDMEGLATAYSAIRPMVCTAGGRLFPPGRLIELRSGRGPSTIAHEALDELIISGEMASSHMPGKYLRAIQESVA